MNQAVYDKLVEVAKAESVISYKAAASLADCDVSHLPDMDRFVKILEEIAAHDQAAGRPMLVVVVIREDLGMPSKGLFKWAKAHGLMKGKDDVTFFGTEIKRVYEYWASHSPD